MKRTLYFAFGSNLDLDQMHQRCPAARALGTAKLYGHRLAFAGRSRSRGGGVATVIEADNQIVYGVLYRIPVSELRILDRYEGHPSFYRREKMPVWMHNGGFRWAWVYRLPGAAEAPPTSEYLWLLWNAYERLGFDNAPLAAAGAQR